MGSFYIINTFMKTFKELLETKLNVTDATRRAITKFGSPSTTKRRAKSSGIGKMASPGLAGARNRATK